MKGEKFLENVIIGGIRTANAILTCADMLGGALLDIAKNTIEGMNNTEEKPETNNESDLESEWLRSMYYRTDDEINKLLKELNLFYYSIEYDGRIACEKAIAKYMAVNRRKVYYY